MLQLPSDGRRRNMAAIRNKNTKPELYVRLRIHSAGFRYRLHSPLLPGRPDLVFPRYRLAVFVNGCFWHGHSCSRARRPTTNIEYWGPKLDENIRRDQRNLVALKQEGWLASTIWECTLEEDTTQLILCLHAMRAVAMEAAL